MPSYFNLNYMAFSVEKSDLVRLRSAEMRDADELAQVFSFLNSPHAAPDNVKGIIGATQESLARDGGMTHLTIVAETLDPISLDPKHIVAGGSLVRMSGGDSAPLLYRIEDDRSMNLFTYDQPTLEFGGMVAHPDARSLGIGMAISAVRALIARYFNHLFDADAVLSDFMPPLNDIDTKENVFWDDLIVNCLQLNGNLDAVKDMVSKLTGTKVTTNTQLSAAIGNILSDDDRNRMVNRYWPQLIDSSLVSDDVLNITRNVNGPTEKARDNLLAIYGGSMSRIGAFPINGGPNYVAKATDGPTAAEGVLGLSYIPASDRSVVFNPFSEGLTKPATPNDLRDFTAYWTPASVKDGRVSVSNSVAFVLGRLYNDPVYSYTPPRKV